MRYVCFNETGDDLEYLSSYEYALSISHSEKTKTRAKECIKHCKEEKTTNICKFCNQENISTSFKIQMSKSNFDGSYNYFKNGGLEVSCCKSCYSGIITRKHSSAILGPVIYISIGLLTSGVLFGIDMIFGRFMILKWFTKLIKKTIFFNYVKDHPTINKLQFEGYKFGKPNGPAW